MPALAGAVHVFVVPAIAGVATGSRTRAKFAKESL